MTLTTLKGANVSSESVRSKTCPADCDVAVLCKKEAQTF